MTEGLSLAGQAEIPIVIVLAQRTGPSTGLPTYTGQTDLLFTMHAGQGEFPRFIVAPGTPEEAVTFSARAMKIAWQYQIPSIILSDKTFSEGMYTLADGIGEEKTRPLPAASFPYKRYANTPDGISPILSPPVRGEVIKVNSYTHDYAGITTEDPGLSTEMAEKRLRKLQSLKKGTDLPDAVVVSGKNGARTALVAWGSVRGAAGEIAELLGLRLIAPVVLQPFPAETFRKAMAGIERLILIEDSSMGQLDKVLQMHDIQIHDRILRYDGRTFAIEELENRVRRCL